MKIKLLLLAAITLTLGACTPDIKDNARSLVRGSVVDEGGNPLADVPVRTEGYYYLLGETTTDSQGNFEFTSLESTDTNYSIIVNYQKDSFANIENPDDLSGNTLYTKISFLYHKSEYQKTYDIPTVKLKKKAKFDFSIERTSTTNDTLSWRLSVVEPRCQYIFDDDELTPVDAQCFPERNYQEYLDPDFPDYGREFNTVLNSEAIFQYRINDSEEESIHIDINQLNTTYVFEY